MADDRSQQSLDLGETKAYSSEVKPEFIALKRRYNDFINVLKADNFYQLYGYFFSSDIITSHDLDELDCEPNPFKKVTIFLKKVLSALETGYTESFYKMLFIMSKYGNAATKDLAAKVNKMLYIPKSNRVMEPYSETCNLITEPDTAEHEFAAVVADIAEELEKCCVNKNIGKIKVFCFQLAVNNIPLLTVKEKENLKICKSVYDIFEVMHPHWKWNSYGILTTIIKRVKSPEAEKLLISFKKKVDYQMKLKCVCEHFDQKKQPIPDGYCKMVAIIEKEYTEISLEDFSEIEEFVNKHLGLIQAPIEIKETQSIEIVWLISPASIDILCSKALEHKEAFVSQSFIYLKVGETIIFDKTYRPHHEIGIKEKGPGKAISASPMFAGIQISSVTQLQSITDKELKRLEEKITSPVSDEQGAEIEARLLLPIRTAAKQDLTVPFLNKFGTISGFLQCLTIYSHRGKYDDIVEAVPMEEAAASSTETATTPFTGCNVDMVKHYIHKDPLKELVGSLEDEPDSQNSKQHFLQIIEEFFLNCTKAGVMIYYTGYGEKGTGNWCFKDGVISFQDIFELYKRYLTHKILDLCIDCCYSGQWVVECAKCLDEMGIGACGHKTTEQGMLLRISASCEPCQKATVGAYASKGIFFDDDQNSLFHYSNKKLSDKQKSYAVNFARKTCLQLEGTKAACQLPDIPVGCSWKWINIVATDFKDRPASLIFAITGNMQGREVWYYLLVEKRLEEKFKTQIEIGTIDVSQFGFVICSGFGRGPPDDIVKKIKRCYPDYVNYF